MTPMFILTAISSFVVLAAILILQRCMDSIFDAVDTQFAHKHMHRSRITDLLHWPLAALQWSNMSNVGTSRVEVRSLYNQNNFIDPLMGKYSCDVRQIKRLKIKYVVKESTKNKFYEICMIKGTIGTMLGILIFISQQTKTTIK